jgi:hypothetical protein
MGAWASGLQGVGNVGSDIAQGQQINQQQKQQDVMNRLNAFAAQAKLQQLQQQLKNTPEAQITTIEKLLNRSLTDSEKASFLGVPTQQAREPKSPYTNTRVGTDGRLWGYNLEKGVEEPLPGSAKFPIPGDKPAPEAKPSWQVFTTDPRTQKPFPDGRPHKLLMDDTGKVVSDGGVEYERPIRASGGDKPLSLAQKAAQFNQTLNVFKTQLSQANTALNQANSQKTSHPIYEKLGLIGTDTAAATDQRNRAAKAISYLLSQKEAVLSGKADAQDVSDKAQSIMDADSSGNGPVAAPGGFSRNADGSYTEK